MKTLIALLRLMRPHQWVRNVFVFTGLLFGHAWNDAQLISQVVVVFIAFCLISSTIYVINDVIDVEQDRHHPQKHRRPLASGQLSILAAVILAIVLGVTGFGLALITSRTVVLILLICALMNVAYSFRLKHVVILDVIIIATGFMLRILVGTLERRYTSLAMVAAVRHDGDAVSWLCHATCRNHCPGRR